jgi:hypothetical protein
VTLELSRRLLATGTITAREIEATLYLSVVRGVSVPRALVDRGIMSERGLEEELSKRSGSALRQVHADPDLVKRLPQGLCRMLAAIPLGTDVAGVVELAAVDPLDGHVAAEFGFHLGAQVRVRRATMSAVEEAVRALELATVPPSTRGRRRTPAFPHGAPESVPPSAPPPSLSSDDVPIPLVRRVGLTESPEELVPVEEETLARAPVSFPTLPPAPFLATPEGSVEGTGDTGGEASWSPAPLAAPRLPAEVGDALGVTMEDQGRTHGGRAASPLAVGDSDPTPVDAHFPIPVGPPPLSIPRSREAGWVPTLPELLELIGRARDRDDLLDLVLRATTLVAGRAALLVMRKEGFVGWMCNPAFGSEEDLRNVVIRASEPSVLATSAATGFYLGPIPQTPIHRPLLTVMGRTSTDVAVYVVKLKTRPTVVIVADELDDTLLGTRALGEITKRCAEALSRLLIGR